MQQCSIYLNKHNSFILMSQDYMQSFNDDATTAELKTDAN